MGNKRLWGARTLVFIDHVYIGENGDREVGRVGKACKRKDKAFLWKEQNSQIEVVVNEQHVL